MQVIRAHDVRVGDMVKWRPDGPDKQIERVNPRGDSSVELYYYFESQLDWSIFRNSDYIFLVNRPGSNEVCQMRLMKACDVKVGRKVFFEGKMETVSIIREASKKECAADRIQVFFGSGAWVFWIHDETLVVEPATHNIERMDHMWKVPGYE